MSRGNLLDHGARRVLATCSCGLLQSWKKVLDGAGHTTVRFMQP